MGIRSTGFRVPLLDELRVSEIGRLRRLGQISHAEYEAGVNYGKIMLLYLASIDAPDPYGGDISVLSDEICLRRKLQVAAAKTVLRDISPRCMRIVDRVAVYDEPTNDSHELQILRSGLQALTGVSMRADEQDAPSTRPSAWDRTIAVFDKQLAEHEARERERNSEDRHRTTTGASSRANG